MGKQKIKKDNNLNFDRKEKIVPIIMTTIILFAVALYSLNTYQMPEIWDMSSINYKVNYTNVSGQQITMEGIEIKDKELLMRITVKNPSLDYSVTQKKNVVKVIDSFGNDIVTQSLVVGKNEVKVPLDINAEKYQGEELKDFIKIQYYELDSIEQIEVKNPKQESTVYFNDMFVREDLSDYFEDNKSKTEMQKELNYIYKGILSDPEIYSTKSSWIHKVQKNPIEVQHEKVGEEYKEIKKNLDIQIDTLKRKGVDEKDINNIISSEDSYSTKLIELQQLDNEADQKLEQLLSGYKKELNTTFKYTPEQINELSANKSSLEQKEALEEELNGLKEQKKINEQEAKIKVDEKVKELKKNKVDNEKIKKIMNNKKLSNTQKLEELNKLK